MARLGLRAGEVAAMRLDDIDWRAGNLSVRNCETRQDCMPLPHDVGAALAAYLSQGVRHAQRAMYSSVRRRHERHSPSGTAIASITRRAFLRADMDPPTKGAHVLRHSLANPDATSGSVAGRDRAGVEASPVHHDDLCQGRSHIAAHPGAALAGRCAMKSLGQAVLEYLLLRRALGFKLRDAEDCLKDFVAFAEERELPGLPRAWHWIGP
ncbi:MAG: tyrosine-type recombinase/integrase [Sterolibacteriaceae bacterium]|nr:tyrosine-type recombinase/integrase [Sterolibacteriaceae bacterium]